jgi:hypothetical protein
MSLSSDMSAQRHRQTHTQNLLTDLAGDEVGNLLRICVGLNERVQRLENTVIQEVPAALQRGEEWLVDVMVVAKLLQYIHRSVRARIRPNDSSVTCVPLC